MPFNIFNAFPSLCHFSKSNLPFRRSSSNLFVEAFSVQPTLVIPSLNFCSSCPSKAIFVFCWTESWSIYPPVPIHHGLRSVSRNTDSLAFWPAPCMDQECFHQGKPSAKISRSCSKKLQDCKGKLSTWGYGREHPFIESQCKRAMKGFPNLSCFKYTSPCSPVIAVTLSSQDVSIRNSTNSLL